MWMTFELATKGEDESSTWAAAKLVRSTNSTHNKSVLGEEMNGDGLGTYKKGKKILQCAWEFYRS